MRKHSRRLWGGHQHGVRSYVVLPCVYATCDVGANVTARLARVPVRAPLSEDVVLAVAVAVVVDVVALVAVVDVVLAMVFAVCSVGAIAARSCLLGLWVRCVSMLRSWVLEGVGVFFSFAHA